MSDSKRAAKEYLARGWSVIPCRGKIPVGPWAEFQKRRPLIKEIDAWPEDANVGIVCGEISNLGVIDVDSDKGMSGLKKILPEGFTCPTVKTPRGGVHLYCQYTPAIRNKVGAGIEGVDFRGEGGFVVAPPSIGPGGKTYSWDTDLKTKIPPVPDTYIKLVTDATGMDGEKTWVAGKVFSDGSRDNDIFHYALRLARGRASQEEAFAALKWIGDRCGFPEREVRVKIASAYERAGREERNLSTEIKNFVDVTDGAFRVNEVAQALNIVTNQDRGTLRVVLHRLKKDGVIERSGKRDGEYVKIVNEVEEIEWWNADTAEFFLRLPLGINDMVTIHHGNVIALGGVNDIGKSCFALNIARDNLAFHPVRYISSEMDGSELHNRLKKWEGFDIEEFKKVKFIQLGSGNSLGKLLDPNAVNIIDYLEAKEGEFFKMGHWITEVYDCLRGGRGVAVVCMQKEKGKEYARGGSITADKSRLYITLDIEERRSVCTIVKSKNFKGGHKPTGMRRYFKVVGGWKILEDGTWHYPGIGRAT